MSSNTAEDRLILLRHPDLRRYLAARFLVGMATQIQTVAVGWQVFSVSGDPFDLGLVSAVNSVFIGASNELGEFESGVTAAWWGIVPAVVIGGGATVAVAVAWSRLFPVLRRLDRFPDPEDRIHG